MVDWLVGWFCRLDDLFIWLVACLLGLVCFVGWRVCLFVFFVWLVWFDWLIGWSYWSGVWLVDWLVCLFAFSWLVE